MSPSPTAEHLAAIDRHKATPYVTPDDVTGFCCQVDGTDWPCDASVLLAQLATAQQRIAALESALRDALDDAHPRDDATNDERLRHASARALLADAEAAP